MHARHYELLARALGQMQKGQKMLAQLESPEFIVSEIQEALLAIYEMLGKQFDDQVMDRVFSEFCLGK